MGSRKTDLPPNYDSLPEDMKIKAMEEACFWALKISHGRFPGDPVLKSWTGIDSKEDE